MMPCASSQLMPRMRAAPSTSVSQSTSMAKLSNSSVKRDFGSAQGTRTCLTPCSSHRTRGSRACRCVSNWQLSRCRHVRSSSWSCSPHGASHSGHGHVLRFACSAYTSTRRCFTSSSTRATFQGGSSPRSLRYSSVSRTGASYSVPLDPRDARHHTLPSLLSPATPLGDLRLSAATRKPEGPEKWTYILTLAEDGAPLAFRENHQLSAFFT